MTEERKLVTVLFADIVGSTPMTIARDPEIVRATLRRTFGEIAPIIERHGGTVEKFIGDEVMAVFGVPQAHDDDADRAVRAAFAIRQRVRELSAKPNAVPLELRIGINTGETVTGTRVDAQFLVTGEPVIAAARIRASAEPGEIIVGALTYRLTNKAVDYGTRRTVDAKGIGPLESWPAIASRNAVPTQFRGVEGLRAPLIGRDEELALLLNAFERTRREARPHLVTIFGAAGAGKSRLSEELVARLGGARVHEGRCLPYGEGIGLWPIQQILRSDANVSPTEGLTTARRRLREAVTVSSGADAEDVDAIAARLEVLAGLAHADHALPDVAPEELTNELDWGLRRYLERRARQEPLVLVFEDVHWASGLLLELVEGIVERAKAPLFVVCLARTEFLDARPGWGGGKVNATNLVLEPLTPDEAGELVAGLLDINSLTENVRRAVVERAEGNPLYVEELIRVLIESEQIRREDGRWVAFSAGPLEIPPTLRGLIAARIDTASAEVKLLLQRAAVIGRFFTTSGIASLGGAAPAATQLRDAVRRDFLVDADERGVGGGSLYRFKHGLIRDVAYESVPKAERAVLHDRYCRWFERTLGDRREDFIDLIAHHAEQAYGLANEMALPQAADLARRAFERLMQSAKKARVREDWTAALALHTRAARAAAGCDVTDVERLEVDAYLALARHRTEASPEALATVKAAARRARDLGVHVIVADLLFPIRHLLPREERAAAEKELRELAAASGDPELIVRAAMLHLSAGGSASEDLAYMREALDLATRHGLRKWRSTFFEFVVETEAWMGRYTAASRDLDQWEAMLGSSPTLRERSAFLAAKASVLMSLGDAAAALPLAEEALQLWRELGDVRQIAAALGALAGTYRWLARPEEALALNDERLSLIRGRAMPYQQHRGLTFHARLLGDLGRMDEALASLDQARAVVLPSDQLQLSLLWSEATVAAAMGDIVRADACYASAAAEIERAQILNGWFLSEWATYLLDTGRDGEARDVLTRFEAALGDEAAPLHRRRIVGLRAQAVLPTA